MPREVLQQAEKFSIVLSPFQAFRQWRAVRSKESDEKQRRTRERGSPLLLPRFYFFALLFTSHSFPLSERLEQARSCREKCNVRCRFSGDFSGVRFHVQFHVTFDDLCYKQTNLQSSDNVLCQTTVLVRTTTRYFKFALTYKCYFPFAVRNSISLRFKNVYAEE